MELETTMLEYLHEHFSVYCICFRYLFIGLIITVYLHYMSIIWGTFASAYFGIFMYALYAC